MVTSKTPEEVVAVLELAARRGRLAGFSAARRGVLFRVDAFGTPFDGELTARAERNGCETRLRFHASILPRMPIVFVLILAATVWPGVVLTESMIASFFPRSTFWQWTWWWYIPLSLPFCPWVFWSAMSRSRSAVWASAHEVVERIAGEVDGRVVTGDVGGAGGPNPA